MRTALSLLIALLIAVAVGAAFFPQSCSSGQNGVEIGKCSSTVGVLYSAKGGDDAGDEAQRKGLLTSLIVTIVAGASSLFVARRVLLRSTRNEMLRDG